MDRGWAPAPGERLRSGTVIRRRLILAALVAVVLALTVACSGDSSATTTASSSVPPRDIPDCGEIYADQKKITTADFGQSCVMENGDLVTPLPVRIKCEDDRQLYWNDLAYGFLNGPMTMTPATQKLKIPQQALNQCLDREATPPG
jgi:hypothetical protein